MTTAFADLWLSIAPGMVDALGGQPVTLRRPQSLRDVRASAPAVLVLMADAGLHATTISVHVTADSPIKGALVAGSLVAVGSAAPIALAATAKSPDTGSVTHLDLVLVAPGLSIAQVTGAAVVYPGSADYVFPSVQVSRPRMGDAGKDLVPDFAARLTIPLLNMPVTPVMGDMMVLASGQALRVVAEPVFMGGGFLKVDCGVAT